MGELKPYTEYKDSGVEWIGEIPKGWTTSKIKNLSNNKLIYGANEAALINDRTLPRFIRITDIDDNGCLKEETYKSLPKDIASKYPVKQGDILFARSGASVGKTYLHQSKYKACYAGYLIKYSSNENKLIPKFLYYFTKTESYKEWIEENTIQATIENVSAEKYRNLQIPYPSLNQQIPIINFLDQKTSQIDALIADKERLIELLKEKRQAVITETVTKGLDPNVNMKDSGIEWIGEVPEHWTIRRLKYLCKLNPSKSEIDKDSNIEVTFVPMENLKSTGKIDYSLTRNLSEVYSGYTFFKEKDILIAKVTPCFENGNIAVANELVNGVGFGTTELHIIRAREDINTYFLYYALQSEQFKQEGISSMYGVAGLKRIPSRFISDYKIVLPGLKEQEQIVELIKETNKEINEAVNSQKEIISKLKEYRESLIYEAVTGKIDVRNYAAEKEEAH